MAPKLGEYILKKPIGRGAMGQVWLAKQESLDRMVAVKVLPKEFAKDQSFRARFEREAKMAASMIHPNVIQIYSFGIEQDVPYFAMEFVQGEDLGAKIRKQDKFTIKESVRIVTDVARALEIAAEKGMVHRDIKPGNIMISNKGIVKVMDFGLAKAASVQSAISQPGLIMGTPSYMSPEQGKGQELDVRSDMYSLGVVLYKLLTGKVPFIADKPTAVIFMHIYEKPQPVRELNPEVPPDLIKIIDKLLAKKPDDRYTDPSLLVSDLEAFMSGGSVSISAAARQSGTVQRTEAIAAPVEPTVGTEAMVTPTDPTVATAPPAREAHPTSVTEPIISRGHEPTSMPTQAGPAPEAYARTEDEQLEFIEDLIMADDPGANARAGEMFDKTPGLRDRYARQLFTHALLRSNMDARDRVGKGRRIMKVLSVLGIQERQVSAAAAIKTAPRSMPSARGPFFYYAIIGIVLLLAFGVYMVFLIPGTLPPAEAVIQMVRDKAFDSTDRIYDVGATLYETGVKKTLTGKLYVRGGAKWVAIFQGGTLILGSNGEKGWINPSHGNQIVLEENRKYLSRFSKVAAEVPNMSMDDLLPSHGKFYMKMVGDTILEKYPGRNLVQVKATSVPGKSDNPIDEATYWVDKDSGELIRAILSLQPGDLSAGPRSVEINYADSKELNAYYYEYGSHNLTGKSIYSPSSGSSGSGPNENGGQIPNTPGTGASPY